MHRLTAGAGGIFRRHAGADFGIVLPVEPALFFGRKLVRANEFAANIGGGTELVMEKIVLRVEGMSCGHCEIAVQDAVRRLPGIKKAKASRRRKEAAVDYDAALVTPEQIAKAINDTGYTAAAC
jgi:copper chaperone CopZ